MTHPWAGHTQPVALQPRVAAGRLRPPVPPHLRQALVRRLRRALQPVPVVVHRLLHARRAGRVAGQGRDRRGLLNVRRPSPSSNASLTDASSFTDPWSDSVKSFAAARRYFDLKGNDTAETSHQTALYYTARLYYYQKAYPSAYAALAESIRISRIAHDRRNVSRCNESAPPLPSPSISLTNGPADSEGCSTAQRVPTGDPSRPSSAALLRRRRS